jgi:hypothetical protein
MAASTGEVSSFPADPTRLGFVPFRAVLRRRRFPTAARVRFAWAASTGKSLPFLRDPLGPSGFSRCVVNAVLATARPGEFAQNLASVRPLAALAPRRSSRAWRALGDAAERAGTTSWSKHRRL